MSLPPLAQLSLTPPADIGMPVGDKRKAKLARTVASGLVKLIATQNTGSLDANGVASLELPTAVGTAAFVTTLGKSIDTWFQTNFALMLRYDSHEGPPNEDGTPNHLSSMFYGKVGGVPGQPQDDIISAYAEWNNLTPEQQQAYMKKVDLGTPEGRQLLFDVSYLDKKPWFKAMPGRAFFKKAMRYTKQGNSGYGQAAMPKAWVSDGFGMWAHIAADVGFPMLVEAMKLLETYGLKPGPPKGFPHPIWKPPKGDALDAHHDQIPPLTLIANLRAHGGGTWTTWVKRFGFQLLAHLDGGTGVDDGATFVVGPMSPAALLVCMEAFNSGAVGASADEVKAWREKLKGPWFLDWEQHLDAFNAVLSAAGHPRIGLIPGAPYPAHNKGHMILWPVGYPHGSFSNPKGGRFTVTLPITVSGSGQLPDPRLPTRLRYLATLSSNGHTREEYAEAEEWLAQDGRMTKEQRKMVKDAGERLPGFGPYSDGKTHEEPYKAIPQIRSPDAARLLDLPVGPLWPISVKPATLDRYNEALARVAAGESLLDMAAASGEAGPSGAEPEPMELEPDDVEDEASEDEEGEDEDSEDDVPLAKLVRLDPPPPPPTPAPPAPVLPSAPVAQPPTAAILGAPGLKIIKVKQPWADALVTGKKNVENRGWPLSQQLAGAKPTPEWLVIAASKSTPTEAMMADYRSRLDRTYPGGRPGGGGESRKDFETGSIVGLLLIKGCYTADRMPLQSVWYNGGDDLGWVVEKAWEFDDPIVLAEDDKFQTMVDVANRPQYFARLEEEIGKLRAEDV